MSYALEMTHPLLNDPWIRECVDAAIEPYAGSLPPDQIEWMRDQLAETLATDPHASKLLRRAHPRPVETSGAVASDPAAEEAPKELAKKKKPGRSA